MKKSIAIAAVAVLIIAGVGVYALTAGGHENDNLPTAGQKVTDGAGREVTVPENLNGGIVTVGGSGPLRFLSCFDVFDKVIEVDKGDVTDQRNGRGYSYAYPYNTFTSDKYHADNTIDSAMVEKIRNKNPSLVVIQKSIYDGQKDLCDTLAKACTVVVIPAQSMTEMWNSEYKLADWYTSCINILGKVLGQEKKAAKHISEVNAIISDIRTYTKAGNTTSTYVAGVTINGSNVWTTTFPTYLPLKLVDGINAYTGTATTPKVDLDAETVGKYKIDRVIIDPSSSDKIKEVSSQLVMNMINGRNTDDNKANDIKLFVTLPIVWDSINYDCVLAGSYYLCYLMHGTLTLEQVKEKINNVFTTYYGENGKNVFNDMSAFFVGKSSANNVELPLLGEVKIKETNGVFTVVSV